MAAVKLCRDTYDLCVNRLRDGDNLLNALGIFLSHMSLRWVSAYS